MNKVYQSIKLSTVFTVDSRTSQYYRNFANL